MSFAFDYGPVRLPDGDRLRVSVSLDAARLRGETVDHGGALPYGFVRVSMSGEVAPRGVRFGTNAGSFGQVRDSLPIGDPVRRVWARWHLNDMHPGCVHQGGPGRVIGEACPWSGYRYGSAWLTDPLTVDGARDILSAFDVSPDVTVLARDGVAVDVLPSRDDALARLHALVSCSWDHALRFEGWALANRSGLFSLVG